MPQEAIDELEIVQDAPCACPVAGWCNRHRMVKVTAQHALCRTNERYRRHWDSQAQTLSPDPPPGHLDFHEFQDLLPDEPEPTFKSVGVGDIFAAGLKKIGFKPCGGCEKRRAVLNRVKMPWPSKAAPEEQRLTVWTGAHNLPRQTVPDPRWAVGVTTAYRSEPALLRSLASLYRAGWTDVRVFAEPGSTLPEGVPGIELNERVRGVFQNWRHALQTLRDEKPDAEFYVVMQDDVLYAKNLKAFLERDLWFSDDVGFVSPYRSAGKSINGRNVRHRRIKAWRSADEYIERRDGYREVCSLNDGLWGALTYVFPRKSVDLLLANAELKTRERKIDLAIHPALARHGRRAWYYAPSLAEHIYGPSSIFHGKGRGMFSGTFKGEEFDCLSLLEKH